MKNSLFLFALGLVSYMPAHAQWTHYDTQTAISGVFGAINHSIESAERNKQKCEKLNLSIPIGISYEYSDLVLDLRYNLGLTKTNKDDNGNKVRSDLLQITLGYKFAL